MADLYQRLGLKRGASEAEIKKAYRTMAKELHPDRNKDNPQAAQRADQIAHRLLPQRPDAAGGRRDVAVRLSLRRGIVSVSGVTTDYPADYTVEAVCSACAHNIPKESIVAIVKALIDQSIIKAQPEGAYTTVVTDGL